MQSHTILIQTRTARFEKEKRRARAVVRIIARILTMRGIAGEITLVDNRTIQTLNRRYHGENKATNVLSFPESKNFPHPEFSQFMSHPARFRYVGEVYLAPDYIKKHHEDLGALLVHGLLHLLGYTHNGKSDTIKMERIEKKFLKFPIPNS